MQPRARLGKWIDRLALTLALFFALFFFFALRTRHLLWGAGLAALVTFLFLYAYSLWRRHRAKNHSDAAANAKFHLHNLMLAPPEEAAQTMRALVAAHHGLEGDDVQFVFAQRPLDDQLSAAYVLEAYHRATAPRVVLIATCAFSAEAAVFARQLRGPRVALLGGGDLLPLLKNKPIPQDAPRADEQKRRRAVWREVAFRASDPARARRYLAYGALLLTLYILMRHWAFLLPGCICLFLAVIARRQRLRKKPLFEEEQDAG